MDDYNQGTQKSCHSHFLIFKQSAAPFRVYEDTENIKSAKPTQDENRRAVRASKRTTQNQGVLSNLSNAPEVQQPVPVTTQFGAYDKSN